MKTMKLVTMQPCCRILNRRSTTLLRFPVLKPRPPSPSLNSFQRCPSPVLGFGSVVRRSQKPIFCVSNFSWGQSRLLLRPCDSRGFHLVSSATSNLREFSSTVEPRTNDKNFERIYVQGGINVKPLVVDKNASLNREEGIEKTEHIEELKVGTEESEVEKEAWKLLENAVVRYCDSPVGTLAANDPNDKLPLNYDQVFIRDFIPSALAFLLKGENEIVKNFLLHTLQLQSWEKTVDCYSPGQGLMPASFKVRTVALDENKFEEVLDPDFGESAIGRVAPVDSGLWWIILLRAYGKITGDFGLQERVDVQTGIKLILNLCLSDGFDMFPTLLVTDGSCMIDRRMGIHGHPLEIQALFYSALRCAREMLALDEGSKNLVRAVNNRLSALSFHIREYYWVDMKKINEIYRYKTEEYSTDATNKFNIYPEQIPYWLMDWIPEEGGYLIGNLQPAHMDFRFFTLGNLWSIVSSLGTPKQNEAILNLVEAKWDDLIGHMPLKICYPALESEEWRIITGSDPKNTAWSYHNAGSWPTLLWQFTLACLKMGRTDLASRAIELAEKRLPLDNWPEYYDTKHGNFIGKQARLYQTWSIASYLQKLVKMPKKMGVNSKAEAARARKSAVESERKDREAREKEDQYWRQAEGAKSRAAKKREEEAEKRAEAVAKKAEARRLAEQEEKELSKSLQKPDKKANRVAIPVPKMTEAELRRRREEEQAAMQKKAEEEKRKQSRVAEEEEYERMVLVTNTNRDDSIIEARTVDEALAKMTVVDNLPVPVDKHPEKRLKASFKAFEEAELPKLKEEKPGLTHTQYKDLIWKLWKKSPDNPLNQIADK